MESVTIEVEHTDTYGGESNYSWVRRYTEKVEAPTQKQLNRKVIRTAKRLVGWTGLRCNVDDTFGGDMTRITLPKMCQVVFITYSYDTVLPCDTGRGKGAHGRAQVPGGR